MTSRKRVVDAPRGRWFAGRAVLVLAGGAGIDQFHSKDLPIAIISSSVGLANGPLQMAANISGTLSLCLMVTMRFIKP